MYIQYIQHVKQVYIYINLLHVLKGYIPEDLPAIVTIRVGSKGHDSNLPAIVTIRVGSKGHDSNLPAIVTIRAGSKGHDLNLPTIVTISTGSRDMIDTACREERSGWKGTEENVIKPTPQVVDSLLFCYFDILTF